ncbi:MAG: STAS domain-containing protein [Streptosporangiaceae bacterium]
MSDPSFPVSVHDGLAVVTTPAEIDISNAGPLREALVSAAATGQRVIVVDMSGTEYCDSTGLNVLVRALAVADREGAELRLVMGGSGLQRIMTVTGVAGMFRIYDTLGEALELPGAAGSRDERRRPVSRCGQ